MTLPYDIPHLSTADFGVLLESLPDAFLAVNGEWRLVYVNARAVRLLAHPPGVGTGTLLWDAFPWLPGSPLLRALQQVKDRHLPMTLTEYLLPLGVWAEVRAFPQDGGVAMLLRDVTADRRRDDRAATLQAVASNLAGTLEAAEVVQVILEHVLPAVGAFGGSVYRLAPDGQDLRLLGMHGYGLEVLSGWERVPLGLDVMMSESARESRPLHYGAAGLRARYPYLTLKSGTVSASALPLLVGEQLLGVMGLSFADDHVFDEDEQSFLLAIAGQCALALDRAALYDAVKEERDRYATLVQTGTQQVWSVSPQQSFVADWWLTLTGQTLQQASGLGWLDAVHPDDRRAVMALWRSLNASPAASDTELRLWTAAHGYRHFRAYTTPRLTEDGQLKEWVGTLEDVTEHFEHEAQERAWTENLAEQVSARTAELRRANALLSAESDALHSFAQFTETVGAQANLTVLARGAVETLGSALPGCGAVYVQVGDDAWPAVAWTGPTALAVEQAAGQTAEHAARTKLAAGLVAGLAADDWLRGLRCGQPTTFLLNRPHALHAVLPGQSALAFMPVCAGGQVVGLLAAGLADSGRWTERDQAVFSAVGRALTLAAERGEHVRQIEVANEELDAFSHSVSHDLRTPLRHIRGFSGMLREQVAGRLGDGELRRLDHIISAADRMSSMVDDLLALARLSRQELNLQPTDLTQLVAQVRSDLAPDETGRRVSWKVHDLPEVRVDAGLIRQVFANLLGNALKYTRTRTVAEIEVWGEASASGLVVHVRDNGVGFDPRYQHRLFGVFQRLHREAEFEGMGVGLANVKRVVERHGGRIWATSVPGEGATFSFSLP
jgi:signal transduction histidine kinase/PAS domain-containing protein